MKKINLNVKENMELVEYLTKYSDYSKSKIKSLIKYKKVYINGKNNFKLPIVVKINDVIEIDLEVKEVNIKIKNI